MGQCYYIKTSFRIRKGEEENLVNAMTNFLRCHNFREADLDLLKGKDIEEQLEHVLGLLFPNCEGSREGLKNDLTADFNASYGWESLMYEGFETMAPFLTNGSKLGIWPDSGHYWLRVRDGKAA